MKKTFLLSITILFSVANTSNAMFHIFAQVDNLKEWYEKYFKSTQVSFTEKSRFAKESPKDQTKLAILSLLFCYQGQINSVAQAIKDKKVVEALESLFKYSHAINNAYYCYSTNRQLNLALDSFVGLAENNSEWRDKWGKFLGVLTSKEILKKLDESFEKEVERKLGLNQMMSYNSPWRQSEKEIREEVEVESDKIKSKINQIRDKHTALAKQKNMTLTDYVCQELQKDVDQANCVLKDSFTLIQKDYPQLFKKVENKCLQDQLQQKMGELNGAMQRMLKKRKLKKKKERFKQKLKLMEEKLESMETVY